jgi:hypothetical protein
MKLNVTLPTDAVTYLDDYAIRNGLKDRTAALVSAIQLLRQLELSVAYAAAWDEWADEDLWDLTTTDGFELIP